MRATKKVSISMPVAVAKDAERLAKRENRTMSELVREALRCYQRERIFEKVRSHMEAVADQIGVHTEEDVVRVIRDFRRENAAPSKEPVQVKALAL